MQDFEDKIAVVTGAAQGIGRALAERFAKAGMKVVLVDVDRAALTSTTQALRGSGATVLDIEADVADYEQVRMVAAAAYEKFGAVHVLYNNVGISSTPVPIWEIPMDEWHRAVSVNFISVVNGIHVFAPLMVGQGSEGHIVNSASAAAFGCRPGMSPYVSTNHAVVALSESLHHDLVSVGSRIKASVVCAGPVRTSAPSTFAESELMPAAEAGEIIFRSISDDRFYIFTHPEGTRDRVRARADAILGDESPVRSARIS
jgi:NAD(P)-dependent dehydrogenase (short-subunit alcohol dehydrogenase family)